MEGTVTKSFLTDEVIYAAVSSIVAKASTLKVAVCVSVCDWNGRERAFVHMLDAPELCAGNARDKAYTAGTFGINTKDWDKVFEDEDDRVFEALKRRSRFTAFGGGLPIIVDDSLLLGGIGVSGASEEQDEFCALAGIHIIEK